MPLRDELDGYLRLPRNFFGIPAPRDGLPDVAILGIPYDITSSHTPGCRFGPDAIRVATDSERSHSYPLSIGGSSHLRQDSLKESLTIEDIGDLEVGVQSPESVSVHISDAASILAAKNCSLLFLGGDHFITYPIIKGLKRGTKESIGLLYFDAHADFYDDLGGLTLSHASTLKRLVESKSIALEHVLAYDLRSVTPDQKESLGSGICAADRSSFESSLNRIADAVDRLYISVDLDVLSPHIVPAVAHPESGGLSMETLVELIQIVFQTGKVRYADIVEFNPLLDNSRITSIAARDIIKELLTGFAYNK
ncbi:MAG: arginase family protein [Candidatus Thorarchaeota archaeon]